MFRRLRQDVASFRAFFEAAATGLAGKPGFAGLTANRLAAQLVGRWPSGAPLMRAPDADDETLGGDSFASNHFNFDRPTAPIRLVPGSRPAGDTISGAPADSEGAIRPRAAHIRKVNPRDLTTEQGNNTDVLARRILRRGIPFGAPLPTDVAPEDDPEQGDRGLLFLCYQSSIVDQFEFLSDHWMNKVEAPEEAAGHDVLVGQNPERNEGRVRRCTIRRVVDGQEFSETVRASPEWIVPTGGGYFFAPSISALTDVLAAQDPEP